MLDPILLFSFSEMFGDFGFIIKLFLLIAIVGFLNQHVENKILKVVVVLFMAYIMLIVDWHTFGFLYVVYAVMGLGISSIFVDYFFMTGMGPNHADAELNQAKQQVEQRRIASQMQSMGLDPQSSSDMNLFLSQNPQPKPKKKKGLFGGLFGG